MAEDKDMIGVVEDQAGQDTAKQALADSEKEAEQFAESIKHQKKLVARLKETWEVDKRLFEMQLEGDNLRLERPVHKFQATEEYLELMKKKIQFSFEYETEKYKQQLEQIEGQIKHQEEQLERNLKKIEKIKNRMGEAQ